MNPTPTRPEAAREKSVGTAQLAERKLLLLQRYSNRTPERFTQFYAAHRAPADHETDQDGDDIGASQIWELRSCRNGLLVLVGAEAANEDVVRLLRKIADLLERPPEGILESRRRQPDEPLPSELGLSDDDIPF